MSASASTSSATVSDGDAVGGYSGISNGMNGINKSSSQGIRNGTHHLVSTIGSPSPQPITTKSAAQISSVQMNEVVKRRVVDTAANDIEYASSYAATQLYAHRNGNLLSKQLTKIPPLKSQEVRSDPSGWHDGTSSTSSPNSNYLPPRDPRATLSTFTPCPIGDQPNPTCSYHPEISGFTASPSVGWFSFLTFQWISPLIKVGYKRDVDLADLPLLPEEIMAKSYTPTLFNAWHEERHRESFRFAHAIWKTFKRSLIIMWVMKVIILILTLTRPVILSILLHGITNGSPVEISFAYICILTLITIVQALMIQHYWWIGVSIAMCSRGACVGLVMDKSLKLHTSERAAWTSGRISNLANVDADAVRDFMWGGVHESWASPLTILLTSIALFLLLGISALVGVFLLVGSLMITGKLVKVLAHQQTTVMKYGDQRINFMSELILNIKLVKLYAWESFFATQVMRVRHSQLSAILAQAAIGACNRVLGLSIPLFVSFLTFTCFILTKGYGSVMSTTLDASTAFTSLLLFNMLKEPMGKLPETMNNAIRIHIAMKRIEEFLVCKEKERYVKEETDSVQSSNNKSGEKKEQIDVALNGTFDWGVRSNTNETEASPSPPPPTSEQDMLVSITSSPSSSSDVPQQTLPSLTLRIPAGQLWMIVGEVGSGKSSILATILGEMTCEDKSVAPPVDQRRRNQDEVGGASPASPHHTVHRRRRIAYTSQVAWLQSASIRDNILFGLPYQDRLYKQVLHVCALESDLSRFVQGDATIVGENGLTLSGGQKQRVNLARALYSQADLYLFDEPLAAVDAHVARWLYERVIGPTSVLHNKTRLLVTHQLQFASPSIDCIVVMKDGKIKAQGTYKEVQEQGVDLQSILQQTHNLQVDDEGGMANEDGVLVEHEEKKMSDEPLSTGASIGAYSSSSTPLLSPAPSSPPTELVRSSTGDDDSYLDFSNPISADTLIPIQYRDEDLQSGSLGSDVYLSYFRAGAGILGYVAIVSLVAVSQAASVASDYFLAYWSTSITHAVAEAQQANALNQQSGMNVSSIDGTYQHSMMFGFDEPWMNYATIRSTAAHISSSLPISFAAVVNSTANTTAPSSSSSVATYSDFLAHGDSFYILIYGGLILLSSILLLIRSLYVAFTSVTAAGTLHDRLFHGIIRAPQWFFESTPSGRIQNRFAKDQDQVDTHLPGCVSDILACTATVIGTLVLIIVIAPLSIFPLIAIGFVYYYVQLYYRPVSRQLKRLESVTRSPIYQQMNESSLGILTIRAFEYHGAVERCMNQLYTRVDVNTRFMYYSFAVHRWLGIRLEALGALVVLLAGTLALFLSSSLGVGLVGLSISATLGLASTLNWAVRQVSEMENQLNSVERMLEFSEIAPEERGENVVEETYSSINMVSPDARAVMRTSSTIPKGVKYLPDVEGGIHDRANTHPSSHPIDLISSSPPPNWPSAGRIEFCDLSLAYRPDPAFPCVLQNVSAVINPGEKIGVVGRTGAGKSTLSLALFRLIDIRTGRIVIDDIDISTISLHDLRSSISIVPQDPLLFQASLRTNIDPFNSTSDERMWALLDLIQIRSLIESLPGKLDYHVDDGGMNFSLGQRQLICLIRCILRGSPIVLFDEATSSLDYETDQVMKKIIQEEFKHCTVLTIAHRLNTILDSDRIMVFDAGKLVEFEKPKVLLSDSNGYLTRLVAETNAAGKIHQEG